MKKFRILLRSTILLCFSLTASVIFGSNALAEDNDMIRMTVNNCKYQIQLEDNETAAAFSALLPMDLSMTELNGNEKYHYLWDSLPCTGDYSGQIHAGDLMLFGDKCVVLFYQDFVTEYSYTKIGHVADPEGLADALGFSDITVSFSVAGQWTSITQEEAWHLMKTDSALAVLDVRTQEEYDDGHIANALLLPYDSINAESASAILPDKDQLILVYCRSGRRSKIGAQTLADLGYTNVKEFGGLNDWPYPID